MLVYRWYCYNFGYVWGCLCETIEILTGKEVIVCLVLNVERDKIGAIALDSDISIKPGLYAVCSGKLMSVPTGDALLGRIVDPLGNPIDEKGILVAKTYRMVEVLHHQLFLELL